MQAQTRNGSPTPAERKLAPPPETPTRALLQRLRRRSSIVPMPHAFGDEELENEDEEDDDAQDSDEQAALERQIDQLLRKGERKDEKIRALEQRCADMDRDLRMEKEKGKALKEVSDAGNRSKQRKLRGGGRSFDTRQIGGHTWPSSWPASMSPP